MTIRRRADHARQECRVPTENGADTPRPRLSWLALFQMATTALVIAVTRFARQYTGEGNARGPAAAAAGVTARRRRPGNRLGRPRVAALVAIGGALLLMLRAPQARRDHRMARPRRPAAARSTGALTHYDLRGAGDSRVELGKSLAELSGLAFTGDGRLWGHGDEKAVISQIDLADGAPIERLAFTGKRGVLRGDFEDIQVVGERIILVTSSGELFEGRPRPGGSSIEAVRLSGGLEGVCSVEGMAWDQPSRSLLLLCKQVRSKRWRDNVVVLAVSPETGRFEEKPRMTIPERELERITGSRHFNGSTIVRHPKTGTYILITGPQHTYPEVDAGGRVVAGGRLDPRRHRQPEGIAIASDLTLLIGDEAAGKNATITSYAWHP
jgi:hypothetical protein